MRVLVVDDDPRVRESLQRSLEFEGYQVDTADDGAEALLKVMGPERRPDLAILDLMMPNVDGLETCRRLRAAGDRMAVLMLTARDALGDRVTGLDAGADDYSSSRSHWKNYSPESARCSNRTALSRCRRSCSSRTCGSTRARARSAERASRST